MGKGLPAAWVILLLMSPKFLANPGCFTPITQASTPFLEEGSPVQQKTISWPLTASRKNGSSPSEGRRFSGSQCCSSCPTLLQPSPVEHGEPSRWQGGPCLPLWAQSKMGHLFNSADTVAQESLNSLEIRAFDSPLSSEDTKYTFSNRLKFPTMRNRV